MFFVRSPIEYLKKLVTAAEEDKTYIESQLDELDKQRDELMERYEEVGVALIDIKAAIKTLEAVGEKKPEA